VVSAKVIFPVPAPGDNPFKSPPGAGFTSALAMFAAWGILVVLVLPELILGIVAIVTGALWLGIIVLVLGCGLGALFLVLGVRMGGAELDRHSPELLVKLQRQA
jgi:ABC-2 type transport system permease protein